MLKMKQFALISSISDIFIPIFGHLKKLIIETMNWLINLIFKKKELKLDNDPIVQKNPIKKISIEISS